MKSVFLLSFVLALVAVTSTQEAMMGAPKEHDPSKEPLDAEIESAAIDGINEYFKKKDDDNERQLVRVKSYSTQVVSGELFKIKLEVAGGSEGNEMCDVEVWRQSWLNKTTADSIQCSKVTDQDKTPEGPEKRNSRKSFRLKDVQAAAVAGINKYFTSRNDNDARKLVRMNRLTTKGAADRPGTTVFLVLEVTGGKNGNEMCNVSVWNKPSENDTSTETIVETYNCPPINRQPIEHDPQQEPLSKDILGATLKAINDHFSKSDKDSHERSLGALKSYSTLDGNYLIELDVTGGENGDETCKVKLLNRPGEKKPSDRNTVSGIQCASAQKTTTATGISVVFIGVICGIAVIIIVVVGVAVHRYKKRRAEVNEP